MKTLTTYTIILVSLLLFSVNANAEVQVEINKKWACCVDASAEKNTKIVNTKKNKEQDITKFIKRLKKKIRNPLTPAKKRAKLRALVKKLNRCKRQKGSYSPDELEPPKTGSAYAKANLIGTGTSIAAKCNFIALDNGTAVTGGSVICNLGALVTASSANFFLFGNNPTISQALQSVTIIPINGQFNRILLELDAATASSARDYLRGNDTTLTADLGWNTSGGQNFDLNGQFEESSGEGDCRLQASVQGQGNSGIVYFDLADGSISIELGDPVSSLTTFNLFAGNSTNSPTVENFPFPMDVIDSLPQSEFGFTLTPEQLAKVIDAVNNESEVLTVGIPQSPIDNTLVGTFTTPQIDCPVVQ